MHRVNLGWNLPYAQEQNSVFSFTICLFSSQEISISWTKIHHQNQQTDLFLRPLLIIQWHNNFLPRQYGKQQNSEALPYCCWTTHSGTHPSSSWKSEKYHPSLLFCKAPEDIWHISHAFGNVSSPCGELIELLGDLEAEQGTSCKSSLAQLNLWSALSEQL